MRHYTGLAKYEVDIADCVESLTPVVKGTLFQPAALTWAWDHTLFYRNSTGDTIAEIKRTGLWSKKIEVFSTANKTSPVATLTFPFQVSYAPEWIIEIVDPTSPAADKMMLTSLATRVVFTETQ